MPVTLGEHLKSLNDQHIYPTGSYCKLPYTRMFYVYFAQSEDGYIKIGCTQNLKSRIRHIQIYNHMKIKLIGKMKGGRDLEVKLHRKFKQYRKRGEWFNPATELLEYIANNKMYRRKV